MRAPESEDELTSKTVFKDARRQYTAEELEYALSRTELFRHLKRNPVLSFIKPKLIGELTGPFHEPDFSKLTSVRLTIQALFAVLRESGFVLRAFEMERVYDWDHESWTDAIHAILDPLTVLVGTVKRNTTSTPARKAGTWGVLTPPSYASSEDSDSSVESPRRMPMRRPPRVMQLAATPAEPETPSTEGLIPKALEDAIVRLMQSTRMQTAPGTTPSAPRYASPTPGSRRATTDTVPQESTDVAIESVSSRSSSRSKRDQEEDPGYLFDLDPGLTGATAAVSTATAGAGVARVHLSAFSELKEFNGKDANAHLMAGLARQWYLQLKKSARTSWTELTDQFCVQYCGKGVSMTSRYYHASKHVNETPLEYLYRLDVAGMRAKIRYSDGEKREHELFINTLGAQEQELASRLTLMEVPDTATLEKKLRARQRGLAHQKKTLFGSNRFHQKASTPTLTPARAVHAVLIATDDYDSGREGDSDDDQICDQDRDDEERAKMFVTGHASQQENPRRDFETGFHVNLTTTDRCLRACKACGDVHEAGKCSLEEFFNQLRQWYDPQKHAPSHHREDVKLGAEVSILVTTFAREVDCQVDTSVTQECVGIRDETYFTVGKTRVKVTLAGNMVYYMDLWVGGLVGQNAIFGMNIMVPAGVRIDTSDGTACLLDEVRIQMIGRRPLYGSRMRPVMIPSLIRVAAGATWVTSLIKAPVGRRTYLRVTNIGEKSTVLDTHTTIGWWTPLDAVPLAFGFVQPGSQKYDEWQTLAYGVTSDVNDEAIFQETGGPMTERREYADPQSILGRSEKPGNPQGQHRGRKVAAISTVSREDNTEFTNAVKTREDLSPKLEHRTRLGAEPEHGPGCAAEPEHGPHLKMGSTEEPGPSFKEIPEYEYVDEEVIFHEGQDLFA
ncbi:Eukaryotic/viral aspartic protease [Phytophthora megakarya]|uniref:Eukaryotic/viral aspartic protease n=1 Tax=Phytophthora megakarya TaxID=4795 RepID=A0A225V4M1_9STRA|nr:Eukaryotic/viral aspartic protease [Phytophthora megakarya]